MPSRAKNKRTSDFPSPFASHTLLTLPYGVPDWTGPGRRIIIMRTEQSRKS